MPITDLGAVMFVLVVVLGVAAAMARMPDLSAGALGVGLLIAGAIGAQWLWMRGAYAAGGCAMVLWLLLLEGVAGF